MTKENFFPKVVLLGDTLTFNSEAIETMELDTEGASVIIIEATNPDSKRLNKELLIMKTNGSLCDDPENIKDVFSPNNIRKVALQKEGDSILSGTISLPKESTDVLKNVMGEDKNEFKLLVCNTESALCKEFKEQFDISASYYRFAYINDSRKSVGKEKVAKENIEERIKIN